MANWKTTLMGIIAGGLQAGLTATSSHNWLGYLLAGAYVVLGSYAKDHDVTGGTKQQ